MNLKKYSYIAREGCMCVASSKVLVVNGVTLFEKIDGYDNKLVIDDIFAAANKGLFEAASMEINDHFTYGFPESIKLDWRKDIFDDECFYEISDFTVIESLNS